MAKTLHSSNSSCAHYRRCFSNIVHNNSGQKNCAECEDIDKWLVESGVYVLCAFALQWTHKKFWSSIYDYSLVILRVEYLKKKKMKSKWVSQWSKRRVQIPRFCSKQFKINIWSLHRTMTLINDDLQKKKRKLFFH